MKKLMSNALWSAAAIVAIVSFIPLLVFGQGAKSSQGEPLSAKTVATSQGDGWRTIEFETTQMTAPDVALTPDGKSLIFTMLGKLFRMPVQGGEAEQLTFGPYYDDNPVISPDGSAVAFQSDRDGSESNIFVLTLATKEIKQLTREAMAIRPAWAPDGQSLLYLRAEQASWKAPLPDRFNLPPPSLVRRIAVSGGEPKTIRPIAPVSYAFYLPDGKIAWTLIERDKTNDQRIKTRIEFLNSDNSITTLRVFEGGIGPIVSNKRADGFYTRYLRSDTLFEPNLIFVPMSEGPERRILSISGDESGFGVSPDNTALYIGNFGHLWKVDLPGGGRQAVPFRGKVTMQIREPTPPPRWAPPQPGTKPPLRTIASPRLSPDGSRLLFQALGDWWEQRLDEGRARRLGRGISSPTFSPDSRQIAFVLSSKGKREIQVRELESGKTRTVAPPTDCGYEQLNWSRQGELIGATACDHDIFAIDTLAATSRLLQKTKDWNNWEPYPQLSDDGKTLYFQASMKGSDPAYYRLRLEAGSKPELLLRIAGDGSTMKVQGQWMANPVPNSSGIRLSKLNKDGSAVDADRVLSEPDGQEFNFTPDGSALLYVAGNKLWSQPLNNGNRTEIPIRFQEELATPPAVLIERVRVLDFASGRFSSETSLVLQNGRVERIGSATRQELPAGAVTVDAGGRFAIPGLFDTHGHQGGCGAAPYISYGVTSVRNMGNRLELQNAHADRGDFTGAAVSRCFYAGRILEGLPGRDEDWFFVHPKNEEDARMYVRSWKARGAQFIKLYDRLPWQFHRAAADEARRLGLPVVAHGNGVELSVKGVTLGYAGLTHWYRPFNQDMILMFKAAGTWWEPTMGLGLGLGVSFLNDPIRFRQVSGQFRQVANNTMRGLWAEQLRTMRLAYDAGVTFLPGTDINFAGLNVHWELEYYAEAGIPPIEVLRLATKEAAKTVGAQDHLGSIEPGKLADLILLDANPLEDIKNTQKIWRVFKGGWMFEPKVLRPSGN